MKNYGAGVVGFGLGIAAMWGLSYWKMKASTVTVPAGTPVFAGGTIQALSADTLSSQLPLGSVFLLGAHEFSVQPGGTVQVT